MSCRNFGSRHIESRSSIRIWNFGYNFCSVIHSYEKHLVVLPLGAFQQFDA